MVEAIILPAALALGLGAVYVWQDGARPCHDGARYVSRRLQPTPFNRRFHHWNVYALAPLTWLAFVGLTATTGSWQKALLFATLPGAWFCVTHPTTVDMPAMALAWLGAWLWQHGHPWLALMASASSGVIHERGPVFAAIYAWHPALLLGLVGVQWWAKAAPPKHIRPITPANMHHWMVGHTLLGAVKMHKPTQDLLSWEAIVWPLRALVPLSVWFGLGPRGWLALGVAYLSRVLGTDTGRFMLWAAPAVLAELPDSVPAWVVALHVLTFRRIV